MKVSNLVFVAKVLAMTIITTIKILGQKSDKTNIDISLPGGDMT